jgi:ABC-type transporter Mla subunit MlaD
MIKFDTFGSAIDLKRGATADYNDLLLHLLTEMAGKIHQLEARLDQSNELLAQLRDKDGDQLLPFADRVLAVIEDSSYTAFTHIEAEIDEKLSDFLDSHSFIEAAADAARESLSGKIEEVLDDVLHDAILTAMGDAEDIVRKGLRSIL